MKLFGRDCGCDSRRLTFLRWQYYFWLRIANWANNHADHAYWHYKRLEALKDGNERQQWEEARDAGEREGVSLESNLWGWWLTRRGRQWQRATGK